MVPFFISAILDFAFRFFVSYFNLLKHECITITSKMIDFVLILLKKCYYILNLAIVPLYSMSAILEFFRNYFLSLPVCSLTMKTLDWNKKMIDLSCIQVKLSYFITNFVMAALVPYYFRFSSFPRLSTKEIHILLVFSGNFDI